MDHLVVKRSREQLGLPNNDEEMNPRGLLDFEINYPENMRRAYGYQPGEPLRRPRRRIEKFEIDRF